LIVTVHEEKCIGAGQCVVAAPGVFDQRDGDGIVVLLESTPTDAEHAATRSAATVCPASAITIQD
jgi:ferredoxin